MLRPIVSLYVAAFALQLGLLVDFFPSINKVFVMDTALHLCPLLLYCPRYSLHLCCFVTMQSQLYHLHHLVKLYIFIDAIATLRFYCVCR